MNIAICSLQFTIHVCVTHMASPQMLSILHSNLNGMIDEAMETPLMSSHPGTFVHPGVQIFRLMPLCTLLLCTRTEIQHRM